MCPRIFLFVISHLLSIPLTFTELHIFAEYIPLILFRGPRTRRTWSSSPARLHCSIDIKPAPRAHLKVMPGFRALEDQGESSNNRGGTQSREGRLNHWPMWLFRGYIPGLDWASHDAKVEGASIRSKVRLFPCLPLMTYQLLILEI